MTHRVFVSSHVSLKAYEGVDYQQCACSVADELQFKAACMDDHTASPDLEARCLQSVRDSDILILILGRRYGALHDGARSLTEIEYETARQYDKTLLVLVQDVPPPPQIDASELERAEAFRSRFDKGDRRPLYRQFTDEGSFREELRGALLSLLHEGSHRLLARNSPEVDLHVRRRLQDLEASDRKRIDRPVKVSWVEPDPVSDISPDLRDMVGGIDDDEPRLHEITTTSNDSRFPQQQTRLVVCGEFGAGKTNFLERLELVTSRGLHDGLSRIPLLLELRSWKAEEESFSSFVHSRAKDAFGGRVAERDLFLLIDEMDNQPTALEGETRAQITGWLTDYPTAWAAIALRSTEGFARSLRDTADFRFAMVELKPMEPLQWEPFIRKNAADGAGRDQLIEFVSGDQVKGDPDIRRMLQRPLALLILCIYARKGRPFPSNAALLFQAFFEAAYRDQCRAANVEPSPGQFFAFLGYRAVTSLFGPAELEGRSQPKDPTGIFVQTAKALRKEVRAAAPRGIRTWEDSYLGFLAAKYLLDQKVSLKSLLVEPSFSEGRRKANRRDVVIHDLVQLDADALAQIAGHDPCLAAECLRDVPDARRSEAADVVVRGLVELLRETKQDEARTAVTSSIASIGVLAELALSAAMQRPDHWLRRRLIGAMRLIDGSLSVELIVRALGDSNKWVTAEAERAVLAFDRHQHQQVAAFIEAFRGKALSPPDKQVLLALWALDIESRPLLEPILGTESPTEAAVVQEEPESVPELLEDGETGVALASQLFMTPGDAALLTRSRAWLKRTAMRENAWGRVWTAVWDQLGGDPDLRRLGQAWLTSVPGDRSGPWGNVWVRLIKDAGEETSALLAVARNWLSEADPDHVSWSHVWRALMVQAPGDASVRDRGVWWLCRGGRPGHGWAVVWDCLREAGDVGCNLTEIATGLLGSTPPSDYSWGIAWPALLDGDPDNPSLRELGRSWVHSASPNHVAWGRIWPRLWKLQPADDELESSGRYWLRTALPSHPGWNWVWASLWETHPNDRMLRDGAGAWLSAAPPTHEGWARVWEAVWKMSGRSAKLQELGGLWLQKDIVFHGHLGWSYVFGSLLRGERADERLAALGRQWLQSAPLKHRGWAHVWRALWDYAHRRDDAGALHALFLDGTRWLHSTGVGQSGFSTVWQALWQSRPDDDLRRLAQDHLWKLPTDSTMMFVWLPISASNIGDKTLTAWGIAYLRGMVPPSHPHWGAVWADLLDRDKGSDTLYSLGKSWLREHAGKVAGWGSVWRPLWDQWPRDPILTASAISGLQGASCDPGTWKSVWRALFPVVGSTDPELLAATVQWLRGGASRVLEAFWLEVARSLSATGQLPDDLADELHDEEALNSTADLDTRRMCEEIVRALSYTTEWSKRWERAWRPNTYQLLARAGVKWLDGVGSTNPAFPYIWRKIYLSELERSALVDVGKNWLRKVSSSIKAWGLVWQGVVLEPPIDPATASAGLDWMDEEYLHRGTWNEVWEVLWDLALTDRARLVELALLWLSRYAPTTLGYARIWCRLWDAEVSESPRLRALAKPFIVLTVPPDGWCDVVFRIVIVDPPDDDLRGRILKWCDQNPHHSSAALAAGMFHNRKK